MQLDLRNVPSRWINLDSATENAKQMVAQFERLGFTRHQRVPGQIIPVPQDLPSHLLKAFGPHYMGCGQAHIDALQSVDTAPVLILEDDAQVTDAFTPVITIPDNTDAVYLGISHGNRSQSVVDTHDGWYRVFGMLAAHAVLYVSERYRQHAIQTAQDALYTRRIPMDNGFAASQYKFNVLACPMPAFIQSANRESVNKWEALTSRPLKPTHQMIANTLMPMF